MKKRIDTMINFLFEELEDSNQLDFKNGEYWLNLEYDYANWILHSYLNLDLASVQYDLQDYYIGRLQNSDKHIVFKNKSEVIEWLCDSLINAFECLKSDLKENK